MSDLSCRSSVPEIRIKTGNARAVNDKGRFVLYWMTAARRSTSNFGLQRAVDWSVELRKPLIVLEALRLDYPWASDRFHRFVIEGMGDQKRAFAGKPVRYYPYVEERPGQGKGLLAAMASDACVVVTDEFPCFFLPGMVRAAADRVPVRVEKVDGNGLLPMRAVDRVFPTAYAFRRVLQNTLPEHLGAFPKQDPLRGASLPRGSLPRAVLTRWPAAGTRLLSGKVDSLAIDHGVTPVAYRGGAITARKGLTRFINSGLVQYHENASAPEEHGTSRLSPYLHFGNISPHQIFTAVARREGWTRESLSDQKAGKRQGWWGMSPGAEAFLDQLVTWRELGFNYCSKRTDYMAFEALPPWAVDTLAAHSEDPRLHRYSLDAFEHAGTHDPLWNAAQNQLRREGHIHNYLRMLWGKKILEWSSTPAEAMRIMIHLNDKYAVDGRDPNSYSGISWVLGRYDRPWGPERPIFGKVRYMSSENTARKFRTREYIQTYNTPDLEKS